VDLKIHLLGNDQDLRLAKIDAATFFASLGHVHRRLNSSLAVLRRHIPLADGALAEAEQDAKPSTATDVAEDFLARRTALREIHAMVWLPPMRTRLVSEALPVVLANAAGYQPSHQSHLLPRSWPRLGREDRLGLRSDLVGDLLRTEERREMFAMSVRCSRFVAALAMATAGKHGE